MKGFSLYSPQQIDVILNQDFQSNQSALKESLREIPAPDFFAYLDFMGISAPFSPGDLAAFNDWPIEKAQIIFQVFDLYVDPETHRWGLDQKAPTGCSSINRQE